MQCVTEWERDNNNKKVEKNSMRILVVMNASEVRLGGGIIKVIINLKKGFQNKKEFLFDYAINEQLNSGVHDILQDDNSTFYQLPNKKIHFWAYVKCLYHICRNGKYDAVHIHGSSNTMAVELLCAYFAGIPKRIVHSHNSQCSHPLASSILSPVMLLRTNALACSKIAGEWLFGADNFEVLHNAFETDEFAYNETERKSEREKLNGCNSGTLVIGMVGNLTNQKNPLFALEILRNLQNPNAMMVYVGDGDLKESMINKVHDYALEKQVLFLGVCTDVARKLQAMDVFLFPSMFEGLGISILEAQIAGCKCIASDRVPVETKYSEDTRYLSLSNIKKWTEEIRQFQDECLSSVDRRRKSLETLKKIKEDYSLDKAVEQLAAIYLM